MSRRYVKTNLPPPYLKRLTFIQERVKPDEFPFTIPAFQRGKLQLDFEHPITIIVGENGTGKSTLLEGIAGQCGFNLSGGNRNHLYASHLNSSPLTDAVRLSWLPKITRGFFMRAESFFNFAHYIDNTMPESLDAYGGKALHEQSHGESFLALFQNKFKGQAIYILDEPEAALSPRRQLEFLKVMRLLELEGESQMIMATHSPILMAYPRAQLLMFDGRVIREASLSETPHYQLMRNFVMNPKAMMDEVFALTSDRQMSRRRYVKSNLPPPFLKRLTFIEDRAKAEEFPFTIPAFQRGKLELNFVRPITIIVGENGTGKSTLLEGLADLCGFNLSGGNRNHVFNREHDQPTIGSALRGSWLPKVSRGFFMRAESFFDFGHYIDGLDYSGGDPRDPYGGKSLHEQSHGESFLALFNNKFKGQAIYILDEPEAALSPRRQLEFVKLMRLLELEGESQMIMATHSPILMAYPRAQLLMFDGRVIRAVSLSETPHYQLMRNFVMNPKAMMDEVFAAVDAELADD